MELLGNGTDNLSHLLQANRLWVTQLWGIAMTALVLLPIEYQAPIRGVISFLLSHRP